jgi:hypothetical protein
MNSDTNLSNFEIAKYHFYCLIVCRYQRRPSRLRSDWRNEAGLRHLGRYRQRGQQDGLHRHGRMHPSLKQNCCSKLKKILAKIIEPNLSSCKKNLT